MATPKRLIRRTLKHFDFTKVHRTMQFLGWTWSTCYGVPTEDRIRKAAEDLLIKCGDGKRDRTGYTTCGSGGLMACCSDDYAELQFVLEEWHEEVEE